MRRAWSSLGVKVDEVVDIGSGHEVEISAAAAHAANIRALATMVRSSPKRWIVPRSDPLELLFFRAIFNALRKRETGVSFVKDEGDSATISFEAFQIGMERLFYMIGDPGFDGRMYTLRTDGVVTWTEFYRVYKGRDACIYRSIWEIIYMTVDQPESSHLAQCISNVILLTIIISSVCFIASTMHVCKRSNICQSTLKVVEEVSLFIFVVEYLVKAVTCWAVRKAVCDQARLLEAVRDLEALHVESPLSRFLQFLVRPANLIDLAAVLPGVVSRATAMQGGAFVVLRMVRLTRILRAFKSPAMASAVRVISLTMQQSTQALYILCFNLMIGVLIFGSLMYMAEGGPELNSFGLGGRWNSTTQVSDRVVGHEWDAGAQAWVDVYKESPFQSIPHACWWAMVTVATVGYGDMMPTTPLGKVVGGGTMLFSLIILALPVGVIGGTFGGVWESCEAEKKLAEEQARQDLDVVAHEVARLDSSVLSKVLIVEVWSDQPGFPLRDPTRPPPALFLGEAKVNVDIEPSQPCCRVVTLPLEENATIVERRPRGRVTVRYEWHPEGDGEDKRTFARASTKHFQRQSLGSVAVIGRLEVTVLSAEGLLTLQCGSMTTAPSNPYFVALCFPRKLLKNGVMMPCCWRGPSAMGASSNPQWQASHVFQFNWPSSDKPKASKWDGSPWGTHPCPPRLDLGTEPKVQSQAYVVDPLLSIRSPESSADSELGAAGLGRLLKAVEELSKELSQHRSDLDQVKSCVAGLAERADVPASFGFGSEVAGAASGRAPGSGRAGCGSP